MIVRRLAAALAILALAAGSASAQNDGATPTPPSRPDSAGLATPPEVKPPPPIGGVTPAAAAAKPNLSQKEALDRVDAFLNGVKVMSGNFTQVNPDGTRSTGQFWISKPGKLRFQYAPPSRIELIADGRSVAVRDRKLNTQDLYLIGQTPLRFLLADRIDLISDTRVVAVTVEPEWINVVLEEKSSIGGTSRIQLMFSPTNYALKQWTVTDAQGYDTTVAIFDVDTTSKPPEKLFYINEQRTL